MVDQLQSILPEIVITLGGLFLFVIPALKSWRILSLLSLAILLTAFDLKLFGFSQEAFSQVLFTGMFLQDRLTLCFQMLILAGMVLTVLTLMGDVHEEARGRRELYALLLLTSVGLLFLVGAQHLALIYVGMELVSLFSYLMTGFLRTDSRSAEAGLKYFLFGSLATGAFIYGISLVYGLTGTMDLVELAQIFPQVFLFAPFLASVSLMLLIVGFGFKVALAPFHMWAPDAYEGAPTPIAAFISVGPKLAGFALLLRVFNFSFSPQIGFWTVLLGVLSVVTMTVGNVAALAQTNVKRLLAYSSIAHAGTMLIGIAVGTPLGVAATLYYLTAYLLMNIGAFAGVIAVGNAAGREDVSAFSGLSRREPFLSFMITVSLLSLAGIPPMAGFFAKMWIFGAALEKGLPVLAIIAGVNSVISIFYYMKVVKAMYLDPVPARVSPIPRSGALTIALGFSTVGLFLFGLWPGGLLTFFGGAIPLPLKPGDLPWLLMLSHCIP